MEDTLRGIASKRNFIKWSLNPCFNGRYSQRFGAAMVVKSSPKVLILVLMEDTLRVILISLIRISQFVLILVLMEDTLRGHLHAHLEI